MNAQKETACKLREMVFFDCCRMESGKSRAANFTSAERELILELVTKYREVLENKRTDHIMNFEKEAAWQNVSTEFNAVNSVKREVKQLKQVKDLCP